ncbi:hypothetical protein PCC7424_5434 (plasmid) [Gloeothece citriformis PCC 7424]|uniref:Uncharacterized protein n=1 Tax=Gloeothece citriformis (strain PCC 7424) TaxID=65393 RepID=B7KMI6_GLOC7|nr:hypothetical protein [Gloeothece citriformis]ACK74008.1 hypothetical protein PCC7424_5434 [Gloeothece citriformis PCC 7424]
MKIKFKPLSLLSALFVSVSVSVNVQAEIPPITVIWFRLCNVNAIMISDKEGCYSHHLALWGVVKEEDIQLETLTNKPFGFH